MLKWLKKHFIPYHDNDHRPHILRDRGIRGIIIFIIFIEMILFLSPVLGRVNIGGMLAAVLPAVMSELTNNERKSQNLPMLSVNPVLNDAAQAKAMDMATKGYFAHTSPEGRTPWYWLDLAGYRYQYAGENLAVNFTDSEDVTRAWMESPLHRANIVGGNYSEVGTGIATGLYQGRTAIFVAQVYANPFPNSNVKNLPQQPNVLVEIKTPDPKETQKQVTEEESIEVLGAEVATKLAEPTIWQKAVASPRNTTNLFLAVAFGFVALALLLYVLIRARNHHRDLLSNGAMALVFILGIFIINLYMSERDTVVLELFNYSDASVIRQ